MSRQTNCLKMQCECENLPLTFAIEILKNGRSSDVNEDCMSIKEILELIPGTK